MSLTRETPFDSVSLEQLRRRRSEKWAKYPADVLPSFCAEMDFAPAPAISAALAGAIADGDLGYAHGAKSGLGDAFAGFASRRWGWEVDPAAVTAVPDVMVGVAELLRGLTEPGAGVVVNTPVYPPFFSVVAETGRRTVEVPLLYADAGRRLPIAGIRAAFAEGTRALLLCNPHNPTGYVPQRDELLAVAELVAEYDGLVLSDEIHAPLTLAGATHVPFCSLPGAAAERAITLTSASKGWNLAGLKCGLAVAGFGSTSCSRTWRRPAAGCPVCSPSAWRRCATSRGRRPTSPGSTSARWGWATTRPPTCSSTGASRSPPDPSSGNSGAASRA